MSPLTAIDSTIPDQPCQETADLDLLAAFLEDRASPGSGRAAAAALMDAFNGLAGVGAADAAALARAGLSPDTIAELSQVRTLALAMARDEACRRPVVSSWTALMIYLRSSLAHAPREQFRALYLDRRNILIRDELRADDPTVQAAVERRIERLLDATAARIVSGRRNSEPVAVAAEPRSFAAAG